MAHQIWNHLSVIRLSPRRGNKTSSHRVRSVLFKTGGGLQHHNNNRANFPQSYRITTGIEKKGNRLHSHAICVYACVLHIAPYIINIQMKIETSKKRECDLAEPRGEKTHLGSRSSGGESMGPNIQTRECKQHKQARNTCKRTRKRLAVRSSAETGEEIKKKNLFAAGKNRLYY